MTDGELVTHPFFRPGGSGYISDRSFVGPA